MNTTTLPLDSRRTTGLPARPFGAFLLRAVLGPPGLQRVHATVSLMGIVVYLVFALVQAFEVRQGLIDGGESDLLSTVNVTVGLLFFVAIRCGANQHLTADPSLAFSQCLFALLSTSFSYAITGPARGAVLGIVLVVLVFAMFSLPVAQIRWLSAIAFGLLASVMWWRSQTLPDRYPPIVEATHAMFAMIIIASSAVLSARMAALRSRLARQRTELSQALELNRRLATLDELTGLINRRHMTAILQAEIERQRRHPGLMSVALIDIDLFKRINDRYGHATGDVVLQGFAKLALHELRTCDVIARWGGEEFLLLLPNVDGAAAVRAVDRLRVAFGNFPWHGADDLRATFSAGVATRADDESVEALVERADQRMYAAKSTGRNRVCDFDSDCATTTGIDPQAPEHTLAHGH
jgi:diguanylate cyclase (GGDEF)-like protein